MPKIDVSEQMRAVCFRSSINSKSLLFCDTVIKTLDPHLFQT